MTHTVCIMVKYLVNTAFARQCFPSPFVSLIRAHDAHTLQFAAGWAEPPFCFSVVWLQQLLRRRAQAMRRYHRARHGTDFLPSTHNPNPTGQSSFHHAAAASPHAPAPPACHCRRRRRQSELLVMMMMAGFHCGVTGEMVVVGGGMQARLGRPL